MKNNTKTSKAQTHSPRKHQQKRTSGPKKPKLIPSRFGKIYSYVCVCILLVTTTVWALLGAKLQQSNADQLVDSRFFENWNTFHNTIFPSAHSFLLKWPIFLLVKLMNFNTASLLIVTVSTTLLTVGAFAYILYRIDRRPAYFGTLILALASILLLVPPQASPGALLPVNMAMLTTRNLEYIFYIGGLILIVKSRAVRDYRLWIGAGILALLIASDKLFLLLGLGGTLLTLLYYLVVQRSTLLRQTLKWFGAALFASGVAVFILWLINAGGLTHISSEGSTNPFSVINSFRLLVSGIIFAVLGIATNFGANPFYDNGVLSNILTQAKDRLISVVSIGYIVNCILLILGLYASFQVIRTSTRPQKKGSNGNDFATKLSVLLVGSTVAGIGAFVLTNHYYVADARYLTISLFAVTISSATYLRSKKLASDRKLALIVCVLAISIMAGLIGSYRTYNAGKNALSDTQQRNAIVAGALANHHVDVLVGDYWRVLPIQQSSAKHLSVMPLGDCSNPQEVLTSKNWQLDLHKHSFAYLLSLDHSATDKPACTLDEVVRIFGRSNASVIVKGTSKQPKEVLIYYDTGIRQVPATESAASSAADRVAKPIALSNLSKIGCESGVTMNIVAHQDDDLLFMNPDISHEIEAQKCIVTVYLTAGDAGNSEQYWLSRELGAEAAYAHMMKAPNTLWVHKTVELSNSSYVTVANPVRKRNVRLIFFRLPDGNISGAGFNATGRESLERLKNRKIEKISSEDKQSKYTSATLTSSIQMLIQYFQPTRINTLATYSPSKLYTDHSDHMAVGHYVQKAYASLTPPVQTASPLHLYYGYPTRDKPANVTLSDLSNKASTFLEYIHFAHDTGCESIESCLQLPSYGSYLRRQYDYEVPN